MRLNERNSRLHWPFPIRGCIAVVKFAKGAKAVMSGEIPLVGKEHRFPPQASFELGQEMMVIDPVPRFFQGLEALRRIDGRADRDHAGQRRF